MSKFMQDKELGQYRDLVKPLGYFEEGFNWKTAIGTMFIALIMLPASMYMQLMIGEVSLGPAAQWVTVILFLEMAKRARTFLKPAEIFILQSMIMIFIGLSPIEGFFWRQYIVQSDAARSFGLAGAFPDWYAPVAQEVLDTRSFFHTAWVVPMILLFVTMVVGRVDSL
ncbi:MAG: peptide transporter, partial [Planctomycetota bacterium]